MVFPRIPVSTTLITSRLLISLPGGGSDEDASTNTTGYFEKCIEDLGGFSAFNNKTCLVGDKALTSHVNYTHVYNTFGLFWVIAFIVAYGEMTLAASVASYYWTREKKVGVRQDEIEI